MKRSLLQVLGLTGVISLISYTAAVLFAPMAYPGYNWMAQAVSDLSAESAPSRILWSRLSSLYGPCNIVCCTLVCIFVAGKLTRLLRIGIDLFAVMSWISGVGFTMFPLTAAGLPNGWENVMHLAITALVVLLSIASLLCIIIGGLKSKVYRSLGLWALGALSMMMLGAVGTGVLPLSLFGIPERFSVFSAAGFTAVLGIYLWNGFGLTAQESAAQQ